MLSSEALSHGLCAQFAEWRSTEGALAVEDAAYKYLVTRFPKLVHIFSILLQLNPFVDVSQLTAAQLFTGPVRTSFSGCIGRH
jgi:hypothetical protein